MKEYLYVMLMHNQKPLTQAVIDAHVTHIAALDEQGKLTLSGPFIDWSGGMVVFQTASLEEAHGLAQNDPFIKEGYKTYEIRTLEWAKKENNYGTDD